MALAGVDSAAVVSILAGIAFAEFLPDTAVREGKAHLHDTEQSLPTGTEAPSPVEQRRLPMLYVLFAAFDILTVLVGLALNHHLVDMHRASLDVNRQWAERLATYAKLRELAAGVNAPANDVFDSQDPRGETVRLRKARREFDDALSAARSDLEQAAARTDLDHTGVTPQIQTLLQDLDAIRTAMNAMASEANMTFSYFSIEAPEKAAPLMAGMHRRFATVQEAFSALEQHVRDVQDILFERELAAAGTVQTRELVLALFVVLMIFGAIYYGRSLSQQAGVDATERSRRLAELVEAREAALEASRLKSEFLANMSHEIRTPMNGVLGATELALETELTGEQREYLELAKSSADALLALLNDILDFSKIEAGKLDLERAPFGLREHLERSVKTLALRAHQKDLELVCHVAPEVPDAIIGDPSRLRQIILNLVGNAIKFTERGEIGVAVRVAVHTESEVALHFEVSDTGIGIPADKQHLIFEAFTQADGTTCRKYGGTGLGLAICTQLVGMMGGRIWVESVEGQGSTFQFTARFGCSEESTEGDPADMCGLSVLIVDDNATNRRILEERTRGWGMLPQSVEDGPSALLAIRRAAKTDSPFDLVLLDGHMPGLDGFGVAERIHKDPDLVCGSLIMLTSAGEQGESARCRELGVAGYLMKPVAASDLRRVIEGVLKQLEIASGETAATPTPALAAPASTAARAPQPPSTAVAAEPPVVDAAAEAATAPPLVVGRQFRFLLAEDNPVNRTIGTRMLTKHGHVVVSAENGAQAVEISATETFDVVLMDVEMPIMNGFEATAAIRARETEMGCRRIPIIALTAHAMQGDRERCLAAGMDDYATKPIQPAELFSTVEALLDATTPEVPMSSPTSPDSPVLDRTALYEQVGDEADLLIKVIEMFRTDSVSVVAKLEAALATNDASEVQQGAHRIKGALLTLGGKPAADVAMKLEHMGRHGDLTGGTDLLTALRAELVRLDPELESVVQGLDIRTAANL